MRPLYPPRSPPRWPLVALGALGFLAVLLGFAVGWWASPGVVQRVEVVTYSEGLDAWHERLVNESGNLSNTTTVIRRLVANDSWRVVWEPRVCHPYRVEDGVVRLCVAWEGWWVPANWSGAIRRGTLENRGPRPAPIGVGLGDAAGRN